MRTIERINYEITKYSSQLAFADKICDYISAFGGINMLISFMFAVCMTGENITKHYFIVTLVGFTITGLFAFISGLFCVVVERKCKFYFNKLRLLEIEKQTLIYNEIKRQEEIHYNKYSNSIINACNLGHNMFD